MIPQFKNLEDKEVNMLIETPVLITILVAGADGKIDGKEIDWGTKLAHLRAVNEDSKLHYYYKEVDRIFNYSLKDYIEALPKDVEERSLRVSEMLSQLNHILPKIDKRFASELYKSFLTYATQVAKSSGGILGYAAISPEEQKWLGLEMIDPVLIVEESTGEKEGNGEEENEEDKE
jgi:hypothetical protein